MGQHGGHPSKEPQGASRPFGALSAAPSATRTGGTPVRREIFRITHHAFRILICALAVASARADGIDANSTVILFNNNDPDSQGLAQYYANRRKIPASQVIGLACPPAEEIQRADYEHTIAAPLRALFLKRGWWTIGRDIAGKPVVTASTIRFVAIMRGMPLKIAQDPAISPLTSLPGLPEPIASRNDASVDSELTTLGIPMPGPAGLFPNPYFRRFTPIRDNPISPGILLTARLDGPTPSIVRAMIDDAISTEKDGLYGWSYVDARGITSGGYAEGDQWMDRLVTSMRAQGLPVVFDNLPPTFPAGYPVTGAAVYFGWYAWGADGPFADPAFRFRTGAVAVHIHSFSAATLRSTTANWCGPLLARGAAATLGNVYEPYLSLTANLDIFQDRLMSGFTLAESAWMSQKGLSWMNVVIGDPLYRPYASWRSISRIDPGNSWQVYRRIVMKASGNALQAAGDLRQAAGKSGDSLFVEALGTVQAGAGDWAGALASFEDAMKLAKDPAIRIRLDLESIQAMLALGKKTDAAALAFAATTGLPPGPRHDLFAQFSIGPLPAPSIEPIGLAGPVPEATSAPSVSPPAAPET
ncbi:MAG: TIGR03790 family protein, partial [Verrucomicrobiae bacterium]